mmetsp:Transcript_11403/g.16891  ORF Transcript_11403/g.16891 Transcript_11403/m.16891 type:complete len:552 (+) Transcript_11403:125-1780(+)
MGAKASRENLICIEEFSESLKSKKGIKKSKYKDILPSTPEDNSSPISPYAPAQEINYFSDNFLVDRQMEMTTIKYNMLFEKLNPLEHLSVYNDPRTGFQFIYPSVWKTSHHNGAVVLFSPIHQYYEQRNEDVIDTINIQLIVDNKTMKENVEDMYENLRNQQMKLRRKRVSDIIMKKPYATPATKHFYSSTGQDTLKDSSIDYTSLEYEMRRFEFAYKTPTGKYCTLHGAVIDVSCGLKYVIVYTSNQKRAYVSVFEYILNTAYWRSFPDSFFSSYTSHPTFEIDYPRLWYVNGASNATETKDQIMFISPLQIFSVQEARKHINHLSLFSPVAEESGTSLTTKPSLTKLNPPKVIIDYVTLEYLESNETPKEFTERIIYEFEEQHLNNFYHSQATTTTLGDRDAISFHLSYDMSIVDGTLQSYMTEYHINHWFIMAKYDENYSLVFSYRSSENYISKPIVDRMVKSLYFIGAEEKEVMDSRDFVMKNIFVNEGLWNLEGNHDEPIEDQKEEDEAPLHKKTSDMDMLTDHIKIEDILDEQEKQAKKLKQRKR